LRLRCIVLAIYLALFNSFRGPRHEWADYKEWTEIIIIIIISLSEVDLGV